MDELFDEVEERHVRLRSEVVTHADSGQESEATDRVLRIRDGESVQAIAPEEEVRTRKLRVVDDAQVKMREKVARFAALESDIKEKKRQSEQQIRVLVKEKEALQEEILAYAKQTETTELFGDLVAAPTVSRSVDPKKLLAFMKKIGQFPLFWNYIRVQQTDLIKDFGETVLITEGVLTSKIESFGKLKKV